MKLKLLVGIILVVLVGGAGAAWYFFLREPNPRDVISRMQDAMAAVDSLHYEAAIEVEADLTDVMGEPSTDESLSFLIPQEPRLTGTVLLTGDLAWNTEHTQVETQQSALDFYVTPSTATTNTPPTFSLGIETRTVDAVTYLQIKRVILGIISLPADTFGDAWYRFENRQVFSELESRRADITGEPARPSGLTPETQAALTELVRETNFLKTIERLPRERIGRVMTRHYRGTVDGRATVAFVREAIAFVASEVPEDTAPRIESFADKLDSATVELWIGVRDHRLYRARLDWPVTVELPDDESGNGVVPLTVRATVNYSKFDEPVTVPAPADAKDPQELISSLLGALIGGFLPTSAGLPASGERTLLPTEETETDFELPASPSSTVPEDADSDGDGLTNVQESFWNTNPSNPDTDGDGYPDGEEVRNGYNPNGSGALF